MHLLSNTLELVPEGPAIPSNTGEVHCCWDFVHRGDEPNRRWKEHHGMSQTGRKAGIERMRAGHGDPGRCGSPRANGLCAASGRGPGARRRPVAGHVRGTPDRDQRLLRSSRFLAHLDNRARTLSPGRLDRAGTRRRTARS